MIAGLLRTLVVPSSGTFHPFYDLYGQYYWYDMVSDKITMNLDEVCANRAAAHAAPNQWPKTLLPLCSLALNQSPMTL